MAIVGKVLLLTDVFACQLSAVSCLLATGSCQLGGWPGVSTVSCGWPGARSKAGSELPGLNLWPCIEFHRFSSDFIDFH